MIRWVQLLGGYYDMAAKQRGNRAGGWGGGGGPLGSLALPPGYEQI